MAVSGVSGTSYAYPLDPSRAGKPVDRNSELYKACVDFESLFIKQMLDVMRKSVKKEGLMDGGMSEEIFSDMLYSEYAKKMAESSQFGLARMIYDQVSSKL
jgi:peptidoglycan hydrolase FlgJ